MGANAPLSIAPAAPEVACAAGDGCSYLRTLAAIERIAGFEHTARRYMMAAARCREHGCRTAAPGPTAIAAASRAAEPVSLAALGKLPKKTVAMPPQIGGGGDAESANSPIRFSRSAHIDILADSAGNFLERRQLKPHALPAKDDALGYLYRYWAGLRGAGALRFSSIDTVHLARAGVIGSMHVVDVSSGDPEDFRFELVGYAVPIGRFEKPRALPVLIYAQSTMLDYNTVRMLGVPRLHHVRCRLEQTSYHYTRLILPFLDARGSVDRLLVAIRKEPGDGVKLEARQ